MVSDHRFVHKLRERGVFLPGFIVLSKRDAGAALFFVAAYKILLALMDKFHRKANFYFVLELGDRHADILIAARFFFKPFRVFCLASMRGRLAIKVLFFLISRY